ncbi:hypothetical protein FAES_3659 [Fibrella aestuarina BUZ 2]|uniref:Uncharacterized protein n=1 Tax=Fibrella aestuarina BUZ 2 TaxID=1166018 RepID=I0KC13_9BACT|nr:hypothetical protein [Fibrella aestuarina]CCH01666.1 hypothetical protein FAES_3659 [Fibrella aestuarina BUZ 2]
MANVTIGANTPQPSERFLLLQQLGKVHRARLRHRLENRPKRANRSTQLMQRLYRHLKTAPVGC